MQPQEVVVISYSQHCLHQFIEAFPNFSMAAIACLVGAVVLGFCWSLFKK